MVADTEDAPAAVWPVAGENRGAWKEAAAAAGSDARESQETVGGLWRASQRWVALETFRKISLALASSYVAYVFYEILLSSICNVQNAYFLEDAATCLPVSHSSVGGVLFNISIRSCPINTGSLSRLKGTAAQAWTRYKPRETKETGTS